MGNAPFFNWIFNIDIKRVDGICFGICGIWTHGWEHAGPVGLEGRLGAVDGRCFPVGDFTLSVLATSSVKTAFAGVVSEVGPHARGLSLPVGITRHGARVRAAVNAVVGESFLMLLDGYVVSDCLILPPFI